MHNLKSVKELWMKYNFILTKTQKRWGIVLFFMTLLGAVFETLGVSIVLPLVQVMIDTETLMKKDYVRDAMRILQIETSSELVWFIGFVVIGVYIIKNVYLFLLSYIRVKYACKVQRELSVEMLISYMQRGYLFFSGTTTGKLLRGMQGSITNTYEALYQVFRMVAEVLTVGCICLYVLLTDWLMAACIAGMVLLSLVLVVGGFKQWARRCGTIIFKQDALIYKTLLQAFNGIKEVLVMHRQKFFVSFYEQNYNKRQKGMIGRTVSMESPTYIIEGLCVAGMIVAVCLKATNTADATVLVPQLATFAVAAFRILPSLGRISSYFNTFMSCVPGINETYDNFYQARKQCGGKIEGQWKYSDKINREYEGEYDWNELRVQNVSWTYPDSSKVILNDVGLTIQKGKSIAFVGASGAGKTTFADIILGVLQPQTGTLWLDDKPLEEIVEIHPGIIGFVPQSVYLLDDSIRNNVAFGISEDKINDDRVWSALRQASLEEFVRNSEKGLETIVGESGMRLSGGQRQRIAIARALYNNPDILVLDEATSALDSETEEAVMEAITCLQGEKTLIIIAHRLTTIKDCDEIYKVENGKLTQCRYEELK